MKEKSPFAVAAVPLRGSSSDSGPESEPHAALLPSACMSSVTSTAGFLSMGARDARPAPRAWLA